MKTKQLFCVVTLVAILAGPKSPLFAAGEPEERARKSAEQWFVLVETGKYTQSWETASVSFKTTIQKEQWVRSLGGVRKLLGGLVSRKLKSARFSRSLPGAADGEYVVLEFNTVFANKKDAVEIITPMLDRDGVWRVSGYYIK